MSRPDQSPKSDPPNPLNAAVELFLVSFGFVGSTVAILAWLFWLSKQTDGRMLIALGVTVLAVLVPLILSVRTFRQTNKDRERFWAEHPELLAKKHADALNNTTFRDYLHDLPQLMLKWADLLVLTYFIFLPFVVLLNAIPYKLLFNSPVPIVIFGNPEYIFLAIVISEVFLVFIWHAKAQESVKSRQRARYHAYLESPAWAGVRGAALEYADGRCQVCNNAGQLHGHHRTYRRLGAELPSDITILCSVCHSIFHEGGRLPDQQRKA